MGQFKNQTFWGRGRRVPILGGQGGPEYRQVRGESNPGWAKGQDPKMDMLTMFYFFPMTSPRQSACVKSKVIVTKKPTRVSVSTRTNFEQKSAR